MATNIAGSTAHLLSAMGGDWRTEMLPLIPSKTSGTHIAVNCSCDDRIAIAKRCVTAEQVGRRLPCGHAGQNDAVGRIGAAVDRNCRHTVYSRISGIEHVTGRAVQGQNQLVETVLEVGNLLYAAAGLEREINNACACAQCNDVGRADEYHAWLR